MEGITDVNVELEKLSTDNKSMEGKYLTFFTEGQLYGIPIADVVQIVGIQEITKIPEFPDYAKGIINLRGAIIPVIDVRLRFGKQEREYDGRTCIIVTMISESAIGYIVDAVDAVTAIQNEAVSPPPRLSGDTNNNFLTGIAKLEGKVVLLLDTAKMLVEDVANELISSVLED